MGSLFQVNTYTKGNQFYASAAAMDSTGDFVVAWESARQDGSGYGIYDKQFAPPVVTTSTNTVGYNVGGGAQDVDTGVSISDSESATIASATVTISSGYHSAEDSLSFTPVGNISGSFSSVSGALTLTGSDSLADYEAALNSVTYYDSSNQPTAGNRIFSYTITDGVGLTSNTATDTFSVPADVATQFAITQPSTVTVGSPFSITVTAEDGGNNTVSSFDDNITLALTGMLPIGSTLGGTLTVQANDGVAVFNGLTLNAIFGDYTLSVTDSASSGPNAGMTANSSPISVLGVPAGSEFQVNTYTAGNQQGAKVASDTAGDYVVVWQSQGQDGDGYGIYAQLYNAAGVTQGSEFQVNTYTAGNQLNPSVAMDANGDFVVAWETYGYHGSGFGIYAQQYNSSGAGAVPYGSQFQVNTSTTGIMQNPSVAIDSAGDFVIAWQNYADDGSGEYDIYAQQYTALGTPNGSQLQVNTYTTVAQMSPSVAMDSAGDLVVVWQGYGAEGYGIYAQQYSGGTTSGGEFNVSGPTTAQQLAPSVAMDSAGDFVVAWTGYGADGSDYGIFAQQYKVNGGIVGYQFPVNTFTAGNQQNASVSMDAAGSFVVTWESYGQDGSGYDVYAQRYNVAGIPQGSEFQINAFTAGNQQNPSVAMDSEGDVVVAWSSSGQDGDGYGVYANRYDPAIITTTSPLTYTAQSGAVAVDSGLTLSDAESATITSATVTISSGYVPSEDVLAFTANDNGTITGSFNTVSGADFDRHRHGRQLRACVGVGHV